MLKLKRLVAVALVTLGIMSVAMPQAQAAGGGVCTVLGDYAPQAKRLTLFCSGAPDMAGVWDLELVDGVARGTSTDGRTLDGTYVEVSNCTVRITVTVTVCFYITAQVCVNYYYCVTVRIWVCISINVNVCITVSGRGEGQGIWTTDAIA